MRKEKQPNLVNVVDQHLAERERVANLRRSDEGRYTVLGVDKFDGGDWVQGRYNSAEESLQVARQLTREAMSSASDASIATVYYAYDPQGNYLGGDVWHDE